MVDYKKNVYDQALIHFALIGGCLGYEKVILTSPQILSKLDLDRLILVLRTRVVHITSIIRQNCDRISLEFRSKCESKCVFAHIRHNKARTKHKTPTNIVSSIR